MWRDLLAANTSRFSDRVLILPVIAWTEEDTGIKMILVLRNHTVIG